MKRGILWSFGDSFTAGSAKFFAQETPFPFCNTVGGYTAYPWYIAQHFAMRSVNLAVGGSNNGAILNQLANAFGSIDFRTDFIIIGLSTPFRGKKDKTKEHVLKDLNYVLGTIENLLNQHRYIITSAFGSLAPFVFDTEHLNYPVKNYVEWGKPNNTLYDICSNNWLKEPDLDLEKVDQIKFLDQQKVLLDSDKFDTLEKCGHPSRLGHKLIADTLIPYVKKVLI